MMNIELCSLLGKPVSDKDIKELLNIIKVNFADITLKKGELIAYAINKEQGVRLEFSPDYVILNPLSDSARELSSGLTQRINHIKEAPEGTLFLATIALSNNMLFDNGYLIKNDIRIGEATKAELYNMFGTPYIENDFINAVGWMVDEQSYAFGYDDDTSIINEMYFSFLV